MMDVILFVVFIVSFVPYVVQSTPVHFDDCGSGEIKSIDIEPCRSLPCHFDQGARANLTIVFQPKQTANYLRLYSTLRTGGFFEYQIEIKDEDPELCKTGISEKKDWGKINCPIVAGQMYTFKASRIFPVSTTWNVFRYSKIKLLNEYGRSIACADWYLQFNRYQNQNQFSM